MTKIRVYELAKEAEMENKDLVAALIEMGYAIKSHSSSLDDETAQDIRQRLGIGQTRTEEKRIQGAGRTTIIRRRTKNVPVEVPPPVEAPAKPKRPVVSAAESDEAAEIFEESAQGIGETEREEVIEPMLSVESEGDGEPELSVRSEEEGAEAAVDDGAVETAGDEEVSVAETVEDDEAEESAPFVPEKHRQGFARVIKRAAIVIAPAAPPRPFTPRPPKRVEAVEGKPVVADVSPAKGVDEGDKGKKAGHRSGHVWGAAGKKRSRICGVLPWTAAVV